MKVSLKMLKLHCYESWGCILRLSSDTRSCVMGNFEFELIFLEL